MKITETGKDRTSASLYKNADGILSGPEDKLCFTLRNVLATTGTEKSIVTRNGNIDRVDVTSSKQIIYGCKNGCKVSVECLSLSVSVVKEMPLG